MFWFNDEKGFGIVKAQDGQEFIIHYSLIKNVKGWRSLKKGQKVILKLDEILDQVSEVRLKQVNQ